MCIFYLNNIATCNRVVLNMPDTFLSVIISAHINLPLLLPTYLPTYLPMSGYKLFVSSVHRLIWNQQETFYCKHKNIYSENG